MSTSIIETGQPLIPLAQLLATLTILLTFSFFIERILAVIAWLIDKLEIGRRVLSWRTPEAAEERVALLERAHEESELLASETTNRAASSRYEEIPYHPSARKAEALLQVQDVTPPDAIKVRKEFWCHLFGAFIGVAGCYYWKLSFVRLVRVEQMSGAVSPHFWEFILLGLLIGAGSKPIHFLMNYLLTRKIAAVKEPLTEEPEESEGPGTALGIAAPAVIAHTPTLEELVGFVYDGGDRPERLEHTHLREAALDTLIYHHTAMHSSASFKELVEVFDQRGWLTGYHCVVFGDGTIRVQCRWDRIGNHCYGYNQRSLGLAFQGNFETDPRVPFANVNGSRGILTPTQPQLEAGARIIALWCLLYKIPLDFSVILPHGKVADKACPGRNFPQERFEKKIAQQYKEWAKDRAFKKALQSFREQPMVMA